MHEMSKGISKAIDKNEIAFERITNAFGLMVFAQITSLFDSNISDEEYKNLEENTHTAIRNLRKLTFELLRGEVEVVHTDNNVYRELSAEEDSTD